MKTSESKWTPTVIEGGKENCPKCGSYNIDYSYGLACGGIGSYSFCLDCPSEPFNFIPDEESETL